MNKPLLCNATFYEHKQVGENLHLEQRRLKKRSEQRIFDGVGLKISLNVACTIDKANYRIFAHKLTGQHVINAILFLSLQSHLNRSVQNLAHLFNPGFYQALQLRELKQEGEHHKVHFTILEPNLHFASNAREI